MLEKLSMRIPLAVTFAAVLFSSVHSMHASSSHSYDLSGTVISVAHDSGFIYGIETGDNVYTMICSRSRFKLERCDWNGHPIATGDQVRFRMKGIYAFMPVAMDGEERFTVQMIELKRLPPLPTAPAGLEGAVVRGAGFAPAGGTLSISSAPVAAVPAASSGSMTPVVAVPTTGGAPVVVVPTAPVTSPVVTGVPVTGGAPITAISVAPTAASAPAVMLPSPATDSGPQWMRVLRVQTTDHVYDVTCNTGTCKLNGKYIQIGDSLVLRIEKRRAYISSSGKPPERCFIILAVRNVDEASR